MPAAELDEVTRGFRQSSFLRAKGSIGLVSEILGPTDWLLGPGDDAAVLARPGTPFVLAAAEAIWPPFVQTDPFGAGVAAVVANVNDIAAMGGRPLGLLDTIVGPRSLAREVLRGIDHAARRYGVPVIGGHLTVRDDAPAVSAFVVGAASSLLASRDAAPGHELLVASALEGAMHAGFPYFSSLDARAERLGGDLELLPRLAEAGWCLAAKDVSMGGVLGSLAMLLEPTGTGATVDLDRVPRPDGVAIGEWTAAFPSYGFLLCAPRDHVHSCIGAFEERGLACAHVGTLDATGELRVRLAGEARTLLDLGAERVTGLGGDPAPGERGR
jgi:hypothetical protein